MSADAEYFADWLIGKIRSGDGSTLLWRKDGQTLVYFDFETPAMFLIRIDEAKIVPVWGPDHPSYDEMGQ